LSDVWIGAISVLVGTVVGAGINALPKYLEVKGGQRKLKVNESEKFTRYALSDFIPECELGLVSLFHLERIKNGDPEPGLYSALIDISKNKLVDLRAHLDQMKPLIPLAIIYEYDRLHGWVTDIEALINYYDPDDPNDFLVVSIYKISTPSELRLSVRNDIDRFKKEVVKKYT